jgi:hypothetical protein
MQRFWRDQVSSFKICHGTNSLYLSHFKQHGISATYPAALEGMVTKIGRVWENHTQDIAPKTAYFRDFERRYDQARLSKQVAFSFSADRSITHEFTLGARQGGEWIRELRHFTREARAKERLLTADERQTVLEVTSFIQVLDSLPALIVKVHAGCSDLVRQYGWNRPLFSTFEGFSNHVKEQCAQWEDPAQLSSYLDETLLPELQSQQEEYRKKYEITVNTAIAPQHLEFELVGGRRQPFSKDYPRLAFDSPVALSSEEMLKLRIDLTGFSYRDEYLDSRFECHYDSHSQQTTVTRKKLTERDHQDLALRNERREMRKAWLRTFNCDLIPLEEI